MAASNDSLKKQLVTNWFLQATKHLNKALKYYLENLLLLDSRDWIYGVIRCLLAYIDFKYNRETYWAKRPLKALLRATIFRIILIIVAWNRLFQNFKLEKNEIEGQHSITGLSFGLKLTCQLRLINLIRTEKLSPKIKS